MASGSIERCCFFIILYMGKCVQMIIFVRFKDLLWQKDFRKQTLFAEK